MAEVYPLEVGQAELLDFCPDCEFVAFDPQEWFKTYAAFRESGAAASFLKMQGHASKVVQVDTQKSRKERETYWDTFRKEIKANEAFKVTYSPREKGGPWRLVAMAGFPLEEWEPEFRHTPYLTWILVFVVIATSLYAFGHPVAYLNYAFVPAIFPEQEWWRSLTAFFLHGGFLHLVGNMYFIWVFGDNVEDYLGKLRFLLLLITATFFGAVAHWALSPESLLPCVGASGGISGVIVFYALQFPRARIAIAPPIVSPIFALFWLIRLKVGWALLIWFAIQGLLLAMQIEGLSRISAAAHIGGALTGAIYWKLWRSQIL